jgi:hypothetical protein
MTELLTDLMELLHPPLSKPLVPGVQVKTVRGYGVIVSEFRSYDRRFGRMDCPHLVVELEDGSRFPALAANLQVVGDDG